MVKGTILPSYEPFVPMGIYTFIMLCGLLYWFDVLLQILRGELRGSHVMLAVMTPGRTNMRLWLTSTLHVYTPPPPPPPPPPPIDDVQWKQVKLQIPLSLTNTNTGLLRANSPHKGQWRGALMFFFYLRLNKRLSKQWRGWWFETPPRPLWRHCNAIGN